MNTSLNPKQTPKLGTVVLMICARATLLTTLLAALLAMQVSAADDDKSSWQIRGDVGIEHNDNVFRLSPDQESRLRARDPRDVASDRLLDMDSASDTILSAGVEAEYAFTRGSDRDLTFNSGLYYHSFRENDAADYLEAAMGLTSDVGQSGRLEAQVEFVFDRFRKNYLSGATDLNSNGNISRSERQYAQGIYTETEPSIRYRHRFDLDTGKRNLDLLVTIAAPRREYDSPSGNRDRDTLYGEIRLDLGISKRLAIEAAWRHEDISSPGRKETILLDETTTGFDRDMNGDGIFKGNAPLVTAVDRSRKRDTLRVESTFDLSSNWRARLEYRYRKSDFSSNNPLDVDHYGNEETRRRTSASVRWKFARRWFLTCLYEHTVGEDVEDLGQSQAEYREDRVSLTVRHRFL